MRCQRCGRSNQVGVRFCVHCGARVVYEATPAGRGGSQGMEPEGLSDIKSELRRLRDDLERLEVRLERLAAARPVQAAEAQASQAGGAPGEPEASATPAPEPQAEVAPPSPVFAASVASEDAVAYSGALAGPPAGGPPHSGAPVQGAGSVPPTRRVSIDWEQVVGRNWFAIIGVVALALGIGFFLKLAFDNQWIDNRGRIILGIVSGVVLLGAGEYTHRRYAIWSQAVTGGGIAVLYLSIYAAFGFYELIPPAAAFSFLALVALLSGLLALRGESLVIALLGIGGAFLTPVLLAGDVPDRLLVSYIWVVDLGILGLSTFRNWRWFTAVGLVASYGLFSVAAVDIPPAQGLEAELGLTGIFLIFVGVTTLFHLVWRRAPGPIDLGLMSLNALAFFGNTFQLLWLAYKDWFGAIALSLSMFYGLVGYGAIRRSGAPPHVALFALATGLIFLTVAVPLQLGGAWITVGWATQGIVLVWVGFLLGSWQTRAFGLGVLGIAATRLLVFDTMVDIQVYEPIMNARFPTFAACVVVAYIGAYLYRRNQGRAQAWEREAGLAFLAAASFLTIWALTVEVQQYFDRMAYDAAVQAGLSEVTRRLMAGDAQVGRQLGLTVAWALYALVLLAASMRARQPLVRWAGLGLLALSAAKLLLADTFAVSLDHRRFILVLNPGFLASLIVLAVTAFGTLVFWRRRDEVTESEKRVLPALAAAVNVITLWTLSAEAFRFFEARETLARAAGSFQAMADANNGMWLSLTTLWTLYAGGLLGLALWKRWALARMAGAALLAVAVGKMALDFGLVEHDPRGYRLLLNASFAVQVLVLLVTVLGVYVYRRQSGDLIEQERDLPLALLVLANVVAVWALTTEALRYFDARETVLGLELQSGRHLTLTILWTVYGIGVIAAGIVARSSRVRLAGIGVVAVPVAKLFALDVFLLEQAYRVVAFVTLGILLTATGFAYQRYRQEIRGFLFGQRA